MNFSTLKVSLLIALVASLSALLTVCAMVWADQHVSAMLTIDTLIVTKLFDVIKMKITKERNEKTA